MPYANQPSVRHNLKLTFFIETFIEIKLFVFLKRIQQELYVQGVHIPRIGVILADLARVMEHPVAHCSQGFGSGVILHGSGSMVLFVYRM